MNRVELILICRLWALLAVCSPAMFAQSSGINPYYKFDVNLNGKPPLDSPPTKYLRIEGNPAWRPTGSSLHAESDGLPDKPERQGENLSLRTESLNSDLSTRDSPPMGYGAYRESNADYWALTASVYGSNIAAIELLQRCLGNNRCRTLPPSMRGRPAMYVTGLGVASGVSYLGYYLKKREVRWWFVPSILATTFDLVFVVGAARRQ